MKDRLLIIFVKNITLGKVKTRLAKTIGNTAAFNIYTELVQTTENATKNMSVEKHIYFSDTIIDTKWTESFKTIQNGVGLGERMENAFKEGFEKGYKKIILIGSDLPTITEEVILKGFSELQNNDFVFGPADDGGYYLIGLSKMNTLPFRNKPWSTPELLKITLKELTNNNYKTSLLHYLNDIDTFEDLEKSDFYKNNIHIQELIKKAIN